MKAFRGATSLLISLLALLFLALPTAVQARARVIKIGTAAPRGTPWANAAEEMGQVFERISDGRIRFKVYAGVLGDEPSILRKLRVQQLQGALFTSTGLSLISKEPMALQLPMIFDSYDELDAVRDAMAPELDAAFEKQGFKLLAWGDAGQLYFFTKKPARSLEDIAGVKTWMWAHDPHGVEIFKRMGFAPVVLSSVDLVPSLQTGMIEAFPSTAIMALSLQAYSLAPHMIDVPWAPVIGAVVLDKKIWDALPGDLKPRLQQAATEVGARLRKQVRSESKKALQAMQAQGLTLHRPNPAQMAVWQAKAREINAFTRGRALDEALVDRVIKIRDQHRAALKAAASKAL